MLIGTNPRREAAVLNARIRKRYLKGNVAIGMIGEKADLTYPYYYLGAGPESLAQFVDHAPAQEEKPMFIIGQGALNRPDGAAVLAMAAKAAASLGVIKDGWNGFNILHSEAALVGALDIGFVPGEGGMDTAAMLAAGALDVLFLLGVDEVEVPAGRLRRLYRHPRRPRRPPCRRDPAGRRLSGKIRDLRQHRRPRADGEPRRVPAGRSARRLGDPARAVRGARPQAAL